ncbi:MAG: alpha/beta hydrolase [Acidimicrobiia bacterium]|nr:alpha/beta hydrolase [Acidimicrobiia bacterium]
MILHSTVEGMRGDAAFILLHSLALDGRVWQRVVPELAGQSQVVTVDLRGHGKSPKSTGYTVEQMADDVADTARELDIRNAVVVGLSMGGCVAQAVAVRHRDLVSGLVLADTTAWYGPDAPETWAGRADKARTDGLRSLADFQLDRWFGQEFCTENADLCADLLECFAANDIDSYASACDALGAFDMREEIRSIGVPTEVIVGEHDPATSPTHARDLAERIAGSALTIIPGAKHLTALERPDVVAAAAMRARDNRPGDVVD